MRKNIFMQNNPNKRKSEVADRFMAIGIKRAIHRWIKLVEEKKSTKGSGRPVKIATRANILRTKKYFNHKSGRSQRKLARRINCTQSYISYILNKRTDIRKYKKYKRPKLTAQQQAVMRPKCRILLKKYDKKHFILDDESYFTLSNYNMSGMIFSIEMI